MAATTRASTLTGRLPPTGRTSPSWSTRSSLTCRAGDVSPISSRNTVPPVACSNIPFVSATGAGERAAHVAEELRLEQRLGDRAAVDRHERPRRAPAVRVDRPRDELLAGAALADDEHGRRRRRRVRDLLVDRQHAGRAADEAGRRHVERAAGGARARRSESARSTVALTSAMLNGLLM